MPIGEGIDIDYEVQDLINHPPHYIATKFEVIDVIEEWFPSEPHLFSAVQYLARWDKKGEKEENLRKAIWYIQRKIDLLKGKK